MTAGAAHLPPCSLSVFGHSVNDQALSRCDGRLRDAEVQLPRVDLLRGDYRRDGGLGRGFRATKEADASENNYTPNTRGRSIPKGRFRPSSGHAGPNRNKGRKRPPGASSSRRSRQALVPI